jgi:hypothetical protein
MRVSLVLVVVALLAMTVMSMPFDRRYGNSNHGRVVRNNTGSGAGPCEKCADGMECCDGYHCCPYDTPGMIPNHHLFLHLLLMPCY